MIAQQPFCWKWISVTKVSKYGQNEYSRAMNASYTFQPPMGFCFYLMQHTPLWRSKSRILRITKTRTKIETLRISHTSSELHRNIPSGSFTKTNLWKVESITDKVWWLSRTYKCSPEFLAVCFCLYLYLTYIDTLLLPPERGFCKAFIIKFVHDLVIICCALCYHTNPKIKGD